MPRFSASPLLAAGWLRGAETLLARRRIRNSLPKSPEPPPIHCFTNRTEVAKFAETNDSSLNGEGKVRGRNPALAAQVTENNATLSALLGSWT